MFQIGIHLTEFGAHGIECFSQGLHFILGLKIDPVLKLALSDLKNSEVQ